MKNTKTELTVVRWDFDKLFRGRKCVWATINAPESNPRRTKVCLSKLEITWWNPKAKFNLTEGYRVVSLSLGDHDIKGYKKSGFYGHSLEETLRGENAHKKGYIPNGSFDGFWKVRRGERFDKAAIRIAKLLFKMLRIRFEKPRGATEELGLDELFSLFVIYSVAFYETKKLTYRHDELMRQQCGLARIRDFALRQSVL